MRNNDRIMKPIIFNQRVTVFTNAFIGYSETNKQDLNSNLGNIKEIGMSQPNFSIMFGPQQIISPNQIPLNSPWFIKIHDEQNMHDPIKVEFMPNKIDIISESFISSEIDEVTQLERMIDLLVKINQTISIGSITRIAYAPSFGLESENGAPVNNYWTSIINIPDLDNSRKQETMVRYNTICKLDFKNYKNVATNRVITISEGQRTETKTNQNGSVDSKTIECVIVSVDINTSGNTGNFDISSVKEFCLKSQIMGRKLLNVINC